MKITRPRSIFHALFLAVCVTMGCEHQRPQNDVDRIRTEDDVRAFLRKHSPERSPIGNPFLIKECDTIRTKVTPFFKVDLDHNGYTDLIVNGRESVIIAMYQNAESYEFYEIPIESGEPYGCEVDSIVDTDSLCFVYVSHRLNPCNNIFNHRDLPVVDRRDTLIGFEGSLVKYRPQKSTKRIATIRMRSHSGLNTYPTFLLEVDILGAVIYMPQYESYTVHSTIGSDSCSRIFRLAERIQPEQLDILYDLIIDAPSVTLEFVFEDGSMKNVETDGYSDPGLSSLWNLLDDVRYANGWDPRRRH